MLKKLWSIFQIRKVVLESNEIKPKLKNTLNPFINSDSGTLSNMIASLMEDGYLIEEISNNVKKYTSKSNKNDYYYMVYDIHMDKSEYQKYLEKKTLKEKLEQKLVNKKVDKVQKI